MVWRGEGHTPLNPAAPTGKGHIVSDHHILLVEAVSNPPRLRRRKFILMRGASEYLQPYFKTSAESNLLNILVTFTFFSEVFNL